MITRSPALRTTRTAMPTNPKRRNPAPRARERRRNPARTLSGPDPGLSGFVRGIRYEALVLRIVVAERRREGMPVDKAHEPPAGGLEVAAVLRRGEHTEHGQHARGFEKRREIRGLQERHLHWRTCRAERAGCVRSEKSTLKFAQALAVVGRHRREAGRQRAVDEIHR